MTTDLIVDHVICVITTTSSGEVVSLSALLSGCDVGASNDYIIFR